MKFFLLFEFILIFLNIKVESVMLNCRPNTPTYGVYRCETLKDFSIMSSDDRNITEVQIDHERGKNNSDIKGFYAFRTIIHFFPRGLTEFFDSIEQVEINAARLEEISKDDLEQFGDKLKKLALPRNSIKAIELDLFEFNTNLQIINLSYNEIHHIDNGVFGRLKLIELDLLSNPCISLYANYRSRLSYKIKIIEYKCKNENYFGKYANVSSVVERKFKPVYYPPTFALFKDISIVILFVLAVVISCTLIYRRFCKKNSTAGDEEENS